MIMRQPEAGHAGYGLRLREWLYSIMFGKIDHEWAYVINESGK